MGALAVIHLHSLEQGRPALARVWEQCIKPALADGRGLEIRVHGARRTTQQNARLWAMLGDVAAQVTWHGRRLRAEEWKCVFTAALKRQDVVPGIDGGFVVLGASTSRMSRRELGDLMDLIEAFGAQQGVRFDTTGGADDAR